MRDSQGNKARFQHILSAIAKIESFAGSISYDDFLNSELILSAVERQLEIVMEAFINLSDDFKSSHTELDWENIYGFRIILAHMYFKVDPEILWDAVKNDIPAFKNLIERLNSELN